MAGVERSVFLMTDIVGSTRLWAAHTEAMAADLERHDGIMRHSIERHDGVVFSTAGDAFAAAFVAVDDAVGCAIDAQRALGESDWRVPAGIAVRMGIHCGAAQRRGDDWFGPPLNETARIMSAAHGRQAVVSAVVAEHLSPDMVADLGEHRLRDLDGNRRLFQLLAPGLPADFPPLRSMGGFVTTLPAQRTALIGRDRLVADIRSRLLDHRLVSLLGPGGVGKTHLAIEAAGRELAHFPGGVFFVDLTTADTPEDVVAALAAGLRQALDTDRDVTVQLVERLDDRPCLVVVDNCEHVVGAVADLLGRILDEAPDVRLLTTSRLALDLHGEHQLPVPPLASEHHQSPAVQLFAERAVGVDPSLDLTESDLDTVLAITRRLDGIPLAIELAAAQVRTLGLGQILDHLNDRFRLLVAGRRDGPDRQQTLSAAIAWSYDLLEADQQRTFRTLSLCGGPFTLATAARALALDDLDAAALLDVLVASSLVVSDRFGSEVRGFRLLESLREYGRARLVEAGEGETARLALEQALLPTPTQRGEWTTMANEFLAANDPGLVLEDATRREAAEHALEAGRVDSAALIYSSCSFRDEAARLDTTLARVGPLIERRDELDPLVWRAAAAAKLSLERATRRYDAVMGTAERMLTLLPPDDPSRSWFDLWRCALTTAVLPEYGVGEIDRALPEARRHATRPRDWILSQYLISKATGLATLNRLDAALPVAREGAVLAPIGKESRDQGLAVLAWVHYLRRSRPEDDVLDEVDRQNQSLGLAELCLAPALLCASASVGERATELVAAARRRPPADITTPYLLAFAWLAIEEGDAATATELLAVCEIYDASTQIGLVHALASLDRWPPDEWDRRRDEAMAVYLAPAHEAQVRRGTEVLTAEIERRSRLAGGVTPP